MANDGQDGRAKEDLSDPNRTLEEETEATNYINSKKPQEPKTQKYSRRPSRNEYPQ
jgi:hypothetical protein